MTKQQQNWILNNDIYVNTRTKKQNSNKFLKVKITCWNKNRGNSVLDIKNIKMVET